MVVYVWQAAIARSPATSSASVDLFGCLEGLASGSVAPVPGRWMLPAVMLRGYSRVDDGQCTDLRTSSSFCPS